MEFFKIRRDIPFMRHALIFNIVSFLTFAAAVFFLITRGLHLSVEFTGGTVMEVGYSQPANVEQIRQTVAGLGYSDVQVRAIARSVEDKIEEQSSGRLPLRKEGQTEGRWVLLDYGEVIVHALTPEERSYYDLESFWGHGAKETYLGSAESTTA